MTCFIPSPLIDGDLEVDGAQLEFNSLGPLGPQIRREGLSQRFQRRSDFCSGSIPVAHQSLRRQVRMRRL